MPGSSPDDDSVGHTSDLYFRVARPLLDQLGLFALADVFDEVEWPLSRLVEVSPQVLTHDADHHHLQPVERQQRHHQRAPAHGPRTKENCLNRDDSRKDQPDEKHEYSRDRHQPNGKKRIRDKPVDEVFDLARHAPLRLAQLAFSSFVLDQLRTMAQPQNLTLQEAISLVHFQQQFDDAAINQEKVVTAERHVGQRKFAHHSI